MANAGIYAAVVIVLVIALVGVGIVVSGNKSQSTTTTSVGSTPVVSGGTTAYTTSVSSAPRSMSTPVAITDPAQVPSGTSALVIAYSSVQVQSSGTAGSGWAAASGSGTVNLLSTVNTSTVIAHANLTENSTINMVRFNVTSAQITVNGTTYNVTVPSGMMTFHLTGQSRINSSSVVLVDVSPVVTAVYSNNSTSFVMVPSTRAVVEYNASASSSATVGSRLAIGVSAWASLRASTPNITITSAALSVSGNVTTVSVTVRDDSNASVTLNNLLVYGPQNIRAQQSGSANASVIGGINTALSGSGVYTGGYGNVNLNAQAAVGVGMSLRAFQAATFLISSSGALSTAANESAIMGSSGTMISSGGSATLTYSGKLSYDDGLFVSTLKPGSQYRIVVTGQGGAMASTSVTVG